MKPFLPTFILAVCWSFTFAQSSFDSLFILRTEIVNFESDEATLDSLEEIKLGHVLNDLADLDTFKIDILAHTDDVGSEKYNQELSRKRAQSVKSILVINGVDSSFIEANFFGEKNPIVENLDEESKAYNRRVEVKLFTIKKLQWLHGQVLNDSTNLAVTATVFLHSKNHKDSTVTDQEGKFRISAPIKEVVGIDVIGLDQLPQTVMRKLTQNTVKEPIIIKTEKIEFGKRFNLKRLNFYGNSPMLLPKSQPDLESLEKFMTINNGTCIKMVGHVNVPNNKDIPRESRSFDLSIARAMTVYDYLINEASVDTMRMSYFGKGNWEMLFPKAFQEIDQAKNRRVEIIIDSCDNTRTTVNDQMTNKVSHYTIKHTKNSVYTGKNN